MSFNINSVIQSYTAILTGISNYSQWSRQVCSLLTMAGWWCIVDGTSTHAAQADGATQATWISNDQQAQAMIAIFIHASLQHYQKEAYVPVGNVTHPFMARDLWQELQRLFTPIGTTGQYDILSKVSTFISMKIKTFLARSITWSTPFTRCPSPVSPFLRISKP